jgi:arylsulfatase A-like enzyme
MIMVDDMRDDDLRFMPWTRRLVRDRGVRFVNSFAPFPLCCPARASTLTGLYTHNHRVFDVKTPYGFSSFRDRSTLATWLQDAGYATVYLGKYLNNYGITPPPGETTGTSVDYVPPGWTSWRASIDGGLDDTDPLAGSTYQFFDTTLSRDGQGFENFAGRYQSRVYGQLTEEIIRERAPFKRPFFLSVNYTAPHHGQPWEADDPAPVERDDGELVDFVTTARPADVKGLFDETIQEAPGVSWDDPDFSDKPGYLRNLPRINAAERRAMLEVTRQRAEALWVVDRQVKRTVDALRASGELARTVLVFTSDNGYFLGEQRMRQGKIYPHEPSLRVPFLIRGPGIPPGRTRHDPVTSIDIAPTLARFAGVTPARRVDGVSVAEVARHGDRGWRRAILTQTGARFGMVRQTNEAGEPLTEGGRRDTRFAIGIRTNRYLYVHLVSGRQELYDLRKDPRQYRNLARSPAYADTLRLLQRQLARMRTCDGRECSTAMPAALATRP